MQNIFWKSGGFFPTSQEVINKLLSNIFDTGIRLCCITPAKIHTPLPHPSFYNSSVLFKFSSVT